VTTTIKLGVAEIRALEEELARAGFEFRPLQHAHFQARGKGVVVSAYRSGKVVVQGRGAEAFLRARGWYRAPETAATPAPLDGPVAGSDESGKGDYFGPLVVAAVVVAPEGLADLGRLGVRDCKQMSDGAILRAAAGLRRAFPCAVAALTPEKYNAAHEKDRNVAIFLAHMHARALAEAIGDAETCERIVIDKFTAAERLEGALADRGLELPVEIRPRAEDNPAVAAASVLARAEFLAGLRDLGGEFGVELPKGAGSKAESFARRFFRDFGYDALQQVAKIHFKTTKRITEAL